MKTARLAAAALTATAVVAVPAAPAVAAAPVHSKPVHTTHVVATNTHAVTLHSKVKPGKTFTIVGWVDKGSHGIDKQKVFLMERPDAKHKWVKATNVAVDWRWTVTSGKARGLAVFSGIKGLKHKEQYAVLHPRQVVGGVTYGASVSKTITIRP